MLYNPTMTAELCYSRGWRDKNLITMVAIVGAETAYDSNFDDGRKYGLFGLPPLVDELSLLLDPGYASFLARERYEEKHFDPWITYATGVYYNFVKQSIEGVSVLFLKMFEDELHG